MGQKKKKRQRRRNGAGSDIQGKSAQYGTLKPNVMFLIQDL